MLEEQETLKDNFRALRQACIRFQQSLASLNELKAAPAGKAILVPLTQSLYVPGTLADANEVLVDVGTGYFVKKTVDSAIEFLERKIALLQKNSKAVEGVIQAKYQNLETVGHVMDIKIRQAQNEKPQ
jgi:prefoldin alpha subunit